MAGGITGQRLVFPNLSVRVVVPKGHDRLSAVRVLVLIVMLQRRHTETNLFPSFPFAGSVLHRTTLRLGYGGVLRLLVHAELGFHPGLLVKNLPDGGRFVAAMFLIGHGLKRAVEGTRKSDRDRGRILVPHAAERARTKRERQEFSPLAMVMIECSTRLVRTGIGPQGLNEHKKYLPLDSMG